MFDSPAQMAAQIASLTESNETLLRSKARLQQDLLLSKKALAAKEQELLHQSILVQQQASQLAVQEQKILQLNDERMDQQSQLVRVSDQLAQLIKEQERLARRSWLQRLFNRS